MDVSFAGSISDPPAGSASDYKIAWFVQTDVWYDKSWKDIASDWTFSFTIGAQDSSAARAKFIEFTVVPASTDPALLDIDGNTGATVLPVALDTVAVARLQVARGPYVREWPVGSGRYWKVKEYIDSAVGPGNNYWTADPSDVYVDEDGAMHLKITNKPDPATPSVDKWFASSIEWQQTLGYGTYLWQTVGPISRFVPSTVLGLFTYEDDSPPEAYHRELDFEYSRWGSRTTTELGQQTIQPHTDSDNKNEFTFNHRAWDDPANPTEESITSILVWDTDKVQFITAYGLHDIASLPNLPAGDVISSFTFTGSSTTDVYTSRNEWIHINFWRYGASVEDYQAEQEVKLPLFEFQAHTTTVEPVHDESSCQNAAMCWCVPDAGGTDSCVADNAACTSASGTCTPYPVRNTAFVFTDPLQYGEVHVEGRINEPPVGAQPADYRVAVYILKTNGWDAKSWKELTSLWEFDFDISTNPTGSSSTSAQVLFTVVHKDADSGLYYSGDQELPQALIDANAIVQLMVTRGPEDAPCDNGNWGLSCTCPSGTTSASAVTVVGLSVTDPTSDGTLRIAASSGSTGALELEGRTVTKTEVRVSVSDGSGGSTTCTKTLYRSDFDCGDAATCNTAGYECAATLTLTDLRAHCGAAFETEAIPGDGSTGLRVDAEMFYQDAVTDAFGGALAASAHTATATTYLAVGGAQVVQGAGSTGVSLQDVQVSRTQIVLRDPAEQDASMDITVQILMPPNSAVGSSGGDEATAVEVAGASFTGVSVREQASAPAACTSTRCSATLVVELVTPVASCDFSGTFTLGYKICDTASSMTCVQSPFQLAITVSALAGTDACQARTVGSTGTAVGVVGAGSVQYTGILGSPGGAAALSWTSSVQLERADSPGSGEGDGVNIASSLTGVEMLLLPADADPNVDCTAATTGTDVFSSTVLTDTDGTTDLVTVTTDQTGDNPTYADQVTLTLGTQNLGELDKIKGAGSGFTDLQASYTGHICVVLTRSAQVGVELPTRRLLREAMPVAVPLPKRGAERRLPAAADTEAEVLSAGGAVARRLTVAGADDDTSVRGVLRFATTRALASGLTPEVAAKLTEATTTHLTTALRFPPRMGGVVGTSVTVASAAPGSSAAALVDVAFALVLPPHFSSARILEDLQALFAELETDAAASQFGADLNLDLILDQRTNTFEVVSGTAYRSQGPGLTSTDGGSGPAPWVLGLAGGAGVLVAAVAAAVLCACRSRKAVKPRSLRKVQSVQVKAVGSGSSDEVPPASSHFEGAAVVPSGSRAGGSSRVHTSAGGLL